MKDLAYAVTTTAGKRLTIYAPTVADAKAKAERYGFTVTRVDFAARN